MDYNQKNTFVTDVSLQTTYYCNTICTKSWRAVCLVSQRGLVETLGDTKQNLYLEEVRILLKKTVKNVACVIPTLYLMSKKPVLSLDLQPLLIWKPAFMVGPGTWMMMMSFYLE